MASNSAPILNDYKVVFAKKRWLETLLGGLSFTFGEDTNVPAFIYVAQIVLFLYPAIVGVPLLVAQEKTKFLDDWAVGIIYGGD
jgi:hypothetical protein